MDLGRLENCKMHFQKESEEFKKKLYRQMFLRQKILRKFEMPYLEMLITTHCNLSCKSCANLIPHISKPMHIDTNTICSNIEKLLSNVDRIYHFKINGGEALLHPQLLEILNFIGKYSGKDKKIFSLRLTTNGTILPQYDILEAMKRINLVVQISDYKMPNAKALMQLLDKHGIGYRYFIDQTWHDMGGFEKREQNRRSLCGVSRCVALYNGKIYICPRSAMMDRLQIAQGDYVDLYQPKKEFQREMVKLYNSQNINACWYCDGDTQFSQEIPAGLQIKIQ